MNNRNSSLSSSTTSGSSGVGLVPRAVQLDFDKEEKKIHQFETVNKKFYRDVKNYVEKLDDLFKSEAKMLNNVSSYSNTISASSTAAASDNSIPPHPTNKSMSQINTSSNSSNEQQFDTSMFNQMRSIKDLLVEHTQQCEAFKQSCLSNVIDPMKNLNMVFPQVYQAIKRREACLKELIKQQRALEKMQEKEHTGPNLVRVNELTQVVQSAKAQFNKENSVLMDELPKFYNSRIDYIKPCVNCLIKSQLDYYSEYKDFYDSMLNILGQPNESGSSTKGSKRTSKEGAQGGPSSGASIYENIDSDEDIKNANEEILKCLSDIKSLSIVAAD